MNTRLYALILAVSVAAACGRTSTPKEQVVNVSVVEVDEVVSGYSRGYLGGITSERIHLVLSPNSGTVTKLDIAVGQVLRKGAPVATIDSPNLRSLNNSSQAALRQARDGYERAKKVYEGGGMTEVQWMEIQTKLAQAESAAQISDKSLADCTIKAPFDCVVSEVYPTVGTEVSIGSRIAILIDEGHLEAEISIPENEYSDTYVGETALVTVPALGGRTFQARISRIGVNSNAMTRSYSTKLKFSEIPVGLKTGMACKVNLSGDLRRHAVIPSSCVKTDDEGRYVWMADSSNVVVKRRVETAGFSGKGIAISDGLAKGDRVIVDGISKVSSGMKVNPKTISVR